MSLYLMDLFCSGALVNLPARFQGAHMANREQREGQELGNYRLIQLLGHSHLKLNLWWTN